MLKVSFYLYTCSLIFTLVFSTACSAQEKSAAEDPPSWAPYSVLDRPAAPQIAEYVRNIWQDKNGNLWFGTNGYGVARYNGDSISYFSNPEGFNGQQITGITEDQEQNLWLATDQGVVKYNWSGATEGDQSFTNYTDEQYFGGQRCWSIFADSKSNIWVGSVRGIFRFNGVNWSPFALPFYRYDGRTFSNYAGREGLGVRAVQTIYEDREGRIWVGGGGGLYRFKEGVFVNVTKNGPWE